MSSKRLMFLTVFCAAVVVLLIAASFTHSFISRGAKEVELPDTGAPADAVTTTPSPGGAQEDIVEVNNETVQAVIMTLVRPREYSREIITQNFWDNGNAVYNINTAVSGGVTAHRISGGGTVKNVIVTEDKTYIWYDGDYTPYEFIRPDDGAPKRVTDEWGMLITYEDIIGIPKEYITNAEYIDYNGDYCIYVEYEDAQLGITVKATLSVELGLVITAEEYEGENLVYKMTAVECDLTVPDSGLFELPDGRQAS